MKYFLPFVLLVASICASAQNAQSNSRPGYTTGDGWRQTSAILKEPWMQGFIDGYLVANHTASPKGDTEWLTSCLRGMKVQQLVAIVDKYLADHPAEWHKPVSQSALATLKITCRK